MRRPVNREACEDMVRLGHLHAAGMTAVGQARTRNEDDFSISIELGLFVVSDGVGGRRGGDVASWSVVEAMPGKIRCYIERDPPQTTATVERLLRDATFDLSQRLRDKTVDQPELSGASATMALLWVRGANAHLVHIGDSRIYLYRQAELSRMTVDHTVTELLLQNGEITAQEALTHPTRGQLSRCMGMERAVYPDIRTIPLEAGDRFLLCSDGLSGMVTDEEIAAILKDNPEPGIACQQLVGAANAAGGEDNITGIVVNWKS